MRGLDLPHRRYSMPEAIMRKFKLGRSSSSSSDGSTGSKRMPRRRKSRVSRAVQTSPKAVSPLLPETSPSLRRTRRSSSVPDLSSVSDFSERPMSAAAQVNRATSSCFDRPGHSCPLCSNTEWGFISSDCTLSQTVSDRTTSTQDSTLSVPSTTPTSTTPLPFTPDRAMMAERSIFSPAGHFIAVHTESILIRPISIVESSDNWNYGFSPDDVETQIAMMPQTVGTITEDNIEAITSGRYEKSTSTYGPEEKARTIGCQTEETPIREKTPIRSFSFPPVKRKVDAELGVAGGNYKDFEEERTIARFSAVPRSNSMVVNTSSVDYTSDSDLSLTDSLEDGHNAKDDWPETRHDTRLVRGEVSLTTAPPRKRLARDAHAYFLTLTGEQDMIKNYTIPDWLTARLKKREEEIKKLFGLKLNRSTLVYRRRKKPLKFEGYNSSNGLKMIQPKETVVRVLQDVPTPKLQDVKPREFVQISEVIKIEMSNKLKTIITKEKQINLTHEAFLKDGSHVRTSEVINNEDDSNSQKIVMRTNVGQGNMEVEETPVAETKNLVDCSSKTIRLEEGSVESPKANVGKVEVEETSLTEGKKPVDCSSQTIELKDVSVGAPMANVGKRDVEVEKTSVTETKKPVDCSSQTMELENVSKEAPKAPQPCTWDALRPIFRSKADDKTVAEILLAAMDRKSEKSVNTVDKFLSESVQTAESYLVASTSMEDKSEQSDPPHTAILTSDDKACNTGSFSVSTLVQTKETFLEEERGFAEEDKATEVFQDGRKEKSVNTMNPLKTSSVQTEVPEAVKSQPKKTSFADKKRDTPTPYCKRSDPQILELNVPPCTCHMCTFHKKQSGAVKKPKPPPAPRVAPRRGTARFQKGKFEAIPEEKGSTEMAEEQVAPLDLSQRLSKGTMTGKSEKNVRVVESKVEGCTQTSPETAQAGTQSTPPGAKKNLVFGRFKAVSDDIQVSDGLEVVRQYKGRAALATTTHEELLTLSKGWINFYLLKDSTEMSDSNNDEAEIEEIQREEVERFSVEIQASPEPTYTSRLPSLQNRQETKKKSKVQTQEVVLPEILSSSSSTTPETMELSSRKNDQRQSLPEVNGRRRHEIKAKREHVSIEKKIAKSEPFLRFPKDLTEVGLPKAVEVARSEHSVSSITSSTVILSESPSPQQLTLPRKKRSSPYSENGVGSSWTVTVAGSSGMSNQHPPDVEMKLSFGNNGQRSTRGVMQYQSHHQVRSNRQGRMIEEYNHSLRKERHSLQYVPELQYDKYHKRDLNRNESPLTPDLNFSEQIRPVSTFRGERDLQVTGLAITPEFKPRVPTQSERDLVRPLRYKFTR